MDFELTEEQRMALDGWKRLVERDVAPIAKEFRDKPFSRDAAHTLMRLMVPYGVGSGWVPEDGGGLGLDFLTSGLMFEELSKVSPDAAGLAWVDNRLVRRRIYCVIAMGTANVTAGWLCYRNFVGGDGVGFDSGCAVSQRLTIG